ncbi:hypothetical protein GGS23DRAFT_532475 [Durotheca rogersii]|uniref:uncharacterized protein n=1 Tax=Durotheca rogersii TaxID=419775 RepID=UPI0022209E1E|nr:uncharacterized protein GGS23DRAFT_532475 [Durotheca rogersii]KAI5863418.1 hypothetical protein GGS23DRAFT_532475 [Durotheca rogersii]
MPLKLPGLYYDKQRRRYFKVENSSTAPRDAAWSSDNVKKRKIQDAEAAAALRRMTLHKNRIARSRVLEEPLMGGFFARECGDAPADLVAASFAQGLVGMGKLPLADARWHSDTNIKHMFVAGKDEKTGICTAYATLDELTLLSTYVPRDPATGRVHRRLISNYVRPASHVAPYRELAVPQISDIKYHERSNRILVTSRAPSSEVSMWAFVPKTTGPNDPRPSWLIGRNGVTLYLNIKGSGDPTYNDYAANTVCPAPVGSPNICMVGTSRGLTHVDSSGNMRWTSPWGPGKYFCHPEAFRDVFAVEFQRSHRDLILFGGRPGALFVADLRTHPSVWDHLDLPAPITHVRSLANDHQVLVAGLRDTLRVLDLRFAGRQCINRGTPHVTAPAQPLFAIDGYRNAAQINIGLDYDPESGVAAAAHDDGTVKLYSVRNGGSGGGSGSRRLANRDLDRVRSRHGAIHCIQFQRFPGDATPTLFVGEHSNINAYSFGVDDPEDEA